MDRIHCGLSVSCVFTQEDFLFCKQSIYFCDFHTSNFQLWLKRKYLEEKTENRSSARDTTDSDSDCVENDADDYVNNFYARQWPAMDNKTAFSQWVELKKTEQRQRRQVGTPKIHHKGASLLQCKFCFVDL